MGRQSMDPTSGTRCSYLAATELLDFEHPRIVRLLDERAWRSLPPESAAQQVYDFVKDEVSFGYHAPDIIPASRVLAKARGECNSKGILLMALLRACGIPSRFHAFTVKKSLQKGAVVGSVYRMMPEEIKHSWVEAQLGQKWINLEGFILDADYLHAVQQMFDTHKGPFCGYAIATDDLRRPENQWSGGDTYIQRNAIVADLGVYDSPDEFFRRNAPNAAGMRGLMWRTLLLRSTNAHVARIRSMAAERQFAVAR